MDGETITDHHIQYLTEYDEYSRMQKPSEQNFEFDITKFTLSRSVDVRHCLGKGGSGNRTLLHMMFAKPEGLRPGTKLWELLCFVMETWKDLYKIEQDNENKTILHMATIMRAPGSNLAMGFIAEFPEQTRVLLQSTGGSSGLAHNTIHHIRRCLLELSPVFPILFGALEGPIDKSHGLGAAMAAVDNQGNTPLHNAAVFESFVPSLVEAQLQLVKHVWKLYPKAIEETNNDGKSPYQHRIYTFELWRKKQEDSTVVDKIDIQKDSIVYFLKDKIMHLADREKMIRLLHGDFQERQLHLDLTELGVRDRPTSMKDVEELIDWLKFENILQYVHIPRNLCPKKTKTVLPTYDTEEQDGIGRKEFQDIFELLRKKGITKIIRLIVDDDEETPHRDEVIETVKCFEIEMWDWRKVDLCSMVIRKAAPKAEIVFLYSSGNLAVLRSWSANDGLNQLEKLREVHLSVYQRVESMARTNRYVTAFQERMKENCGPLVIIHQPRIQRFTARTNQSWFPGSEKQTTTTWLEVMDSFNDYISARQVQPEDAIRVAIINDGIDGMDPDVKDYINEGISFFTKQDGFRHSRSDQYHPYYFSSTGEGTLMAHLVLRICPMAQLYIARLNHEEIGSKKPQYTAESAAKAIRWAIKHKVHVISMSWTIRETSRNSDELKDLDKAIDEARNARILMLGAASDLGYNSSSTPYPAKHTGVICIGAAKASGHVEDFAEKDSEFAFPGGSLGIELPRSQRSVSDSSSAVATALATGLTSLILYCVGISKCGKEGYRDYLQDCDHMRLVFKHMAPKEQPKYIGVDKCFGEKFRDSSWQRDGQSNLDNAVRYIITGCINKKQGW